MKAKEMFENLGFKLENDDESEIRYSANYINSYTNYIVFDKIKKHISCFIVSVKPFTPPFDMPITVYSLQAINRQVKELGW